MKNRNSLVLCALLGLLTLGIYWSTTSCQFISLDDPMYVSRNPYIQNGVTWKSVEWAFQTDYAGNWHPLTWISHMLDCQLFGLKPAGHHLTNAVLHSLNAMLLFLVLLRLTGATWRSWIVAGLFAWHPAHIESVAWIAERKDVLSTFFGFLTMLAYVTYVGRSKIKSPQAKYFYVVALLCFALSLLAKQMFVTLPCLFLLLDFWPLQRLQLNGLRNPASASTAAGNPAASRTSFGILVLEKIPFLLLTIVACVMTFRAQNSWHAVMGLQKFSIPSRAAHAFIAYVKYVDIILWPSKLAIFYPDLSVPSLQHALIAAFLVVAVSVAAWQSLRKSPYFAVGWFWFLGTLVPVIGLVQVGSQSMADRYTYFPSIGLFIVIVWGAAEFWERKAWRIVLASGATAALAACVVATAMQLQNWRNTTALFEHAIQVTKGNYVAYSTVSEEFENAGKWQEAYSYATNAIALRPDYPPSSFCLGRYYAASGQLDKAASSFEQAVSGAAYNSEYHQQLGLIYYQQRNVDAAVNEFVTAVALYPRDTISQAKLGLICSQKKDIAGAVQHYKMALVADPNFFEALNNLAWIYATYSDPQIRNGAEAVRLAERACDVTQEREPFLLGTLAAAYAEAGQFTNAVATATKAHDLALTRNQKAVADRNAELIELYKSGRAFHEGEAVTN